MTTLTESAKKRIMRDIKEISKSPLDSMQIYVKHDADNISEATALIVGPDGTPYDYGNYWFHFTFPSDYPFGPPKVKFLTADPAGKTRFHPNLYVEGKVCLSLLNTWQGPSWTSVHTFSSVLISIKSIMNENPLINEPGHESDDDIRHKNYNGCIEYENLRVAIIYNLRYPNKRFVHFLPVMEQNFLNSFQKIRAKYVALRDKNQGVTFTCDVFRMSVKCDYDHLLAELDSLYGDLLLKYPNFGAVNTTGVGSSSSSSATSSSSSNSATSGSSSSPTSSSSSSGATSSSNSGTTSSATTVSTIGSLKSENPVKKQEVKVKISFKTNKTEKTEVKDEDKSVKTENKTESIEPKVESKESKDTKESKPEPKVDSKETNPEPKVESKESKPEPKMSKPAPKSIVYKPIAKKTEDKPEPKEEAKTELESKVESKVESKEESKESKVEVSEVTGKKIKIAVVKKNTKTINV